MNRLNRLNQRFCVEPGGSAIAAFLEFYRKSNLVNRRFKRFKRFKRGKEGKGERTAVLC